MNLGDIDLHKIFEISILLLIGMGPKVALVPFLDLTKEMEGDMQRKVASHGANLRWHRDAS